MVDRIRPGLGPQAVPHTRGRQESPPPQGTAAEGFKAVFQQRLVNGELRFSAHAQRRLQDSGIRLSAAQMNAIGQAANRAAAKGSRDSLMLLPDLALVVSVQNRTVVTAVDGMRMKENIFTNIDSAMILDVR